MGIIVSELECINEEERPISKLKQMITQLIYYNYNQLKLRKYVYTSNQ